MRRRRRLLRQLPVLLRRALLLRPPTRRKSSAEPRPLAIRWGIIRAASTDADFAQARALFEEYAAGLGIDLCFQGFARELDTLSQMYGAPRGVLLLAEMGDSYAGCVAVPPIDGAVCELKRLYVRCAYRGTGLGRRLTETALLAAREMGYKSIRLDTLPQMAAARRLYENLGFRNIPAYYGKPMAGQRFMEAALS
jgi:ribosomal protein S18 acetylase RimI-like enzyme